jgi:hypothetical protein
MARKRLSPRELRAWMALATILEAVACGEITPGEARDLAGILETARKGIELVDLEARLTALEQRTGR